MNEQIKFRVWNIKKKKFVENLGSFYIASNGTLIEFSARVGLSCGADTEGNHSCIGTMHHKPSLEYRVQIFTGMKDQNDKEIYQDDIVLSDYDSLIGIIKFGAANVIAVDLDYSCNAFGWHAHLSSDERFILGSANSGTSSKQLKVIGNTYETPEIIAWQSVISGKLFI